jgi:hypothetical protein
MKTVKPMADVQFGMLMLKARQINAERSKMERKSGLAAPEDCDLCTLLRTVEQALEAGIKMRDVDCLAEGVDMLRQAIALLKPARSRAS